MISVESAIARILSVTTTLSSEPVGLLDALDRVLAQSIASSEDLPPFDNSSMDGFAVIAQNTQSASLATPVHLTLSMDILAGTTPTAAITDGQAARIMTGAPIPLGADAIVPIEDTAVTWESATAIGADIEVNHPASVGAYIRRRGENIRSGSIVLKAGSVLSAADIGMLASLGIVTIETIKRPRVAVITSGDEIVRFDQTPATGQIRDGNSPALAARISQCGGMPFIIPSARDTLEDMHRMIDEALAARPDIIVSTAGVSVGAADFTRQALEDRGTLDFWKINIRPGKPLAFGNIQGIPFYGLPGNPVSALVTFEILVRPALLKMAGRPHTVQYVQAVAAHDFTSDGRESYLRVRLSQHNNQWYATETGTQSSGALMSLVEADGLMIVPSGVTSIAKGQSATVHLLRTPRQEEVYGYQ